MVCKKYDLFSNHMHQWYISFLLPYTGIKSHRYISSGWLRSYVVVTGTVKQILLSQHVVPVGLLLSTTGLVNGSGACDCANRHNFWAGSLSWFVFCHIT